MGVRAWVATGLLAVGLWAEPATAAVTTISVPDIIIDANFKTSAAPILFDPVYLAPGDILKIDFNIINNGPYRASLFLFLRPPDDRSVSFYPWYDQSTAQFYDAPSYLNVGSLGRLSGGGGQWFLPIGTTASGGSISYRYLDLPGAPPAPTVYVDRFFVVATAAPEPATWAMMLLGLAGIATFGRQRSRVGQTV